MILGIILGIIITVGILILLYFLFFKKYLERVSKNSLDSFDQLSSKIFEQNINKFLEVASNVLNEKKKEIKEELSDKERKFGDLVEKIDRELKSHKDHVNKLETERIKTFAELQKELNKQGEITQELKFSTTKLSQILSSSKLRGSYGEKIAEDILKSGNLIEGVHYLKNKKQETVATRPDFTFLMPNGVKKINMDSKFPLDNFVKMVNSDNLDNQDEANSFKKLFLKDIKDKITEVSSRDYINPEENTLDYVLLFIPNESIASFINENFAEIFDLAVKKGVLLTSPYQLFGFIGIIRQSFQNFYYEERTKTILNLINEFVKRYTAFKERFSSIGEKIDKVKETYSDIEQKNFKQLDLTLKKIENQKSGLPLEEEPQVPKIEGPVA